MMPPRGVCVCVCDACCCVVLLLLLYFVLLLLYLVFLLLYYYVMMRWRSAEAGCGLRAPLTRILSKIQVNQFADQDQQITKHAHTHTQK